MDKYGPIYTEVTECQDCYKCIRHCPVKAIRVEQNHAVIIPEKCCLCGNCLDVCPVGAKKVRDDSYLVQSLLENKGTVVAAIAPSLFAMEAAHIIPQMLPALGAMGFDAWSAVSEGAAWVNEQVQTTLSAEHIVSSACPSANRYLHLYGPEGLEVMDVVSPMLATGYALKKDFDHVVFIGPCVAKKWESDSYPESVDVSITIDEFLSLAERMHADVSLDLNDSDVYAYKLLGSDAEQRYPAPGGMIASLNERAEQPVRGIGLSGIDDFRERFADISGLMKTLAGNNDRVLVEPLACRGGCLEGHCKVSKRSRLQAEWVMENQLIGQSEPLPYSCTETSDSCVDVPELVHGDYGNLSAELAEFHWPMFTPVREEADQSAVDAFMRSIGKFSPEDEKDCGGCGYDSCRRFAEAAVNGQAERSMCVSNLRAAAERKANAMMKSMPAPVVICDAELNILECNEGFISAFLPQAAGLLHDENQAKLRNVNLGNLLPDCRSIRAVLKEGEGSREQNIRIDGRVFRLTIFPIDRNRSVGCLLQDITQPVVQREAVIKSARTVLEKNVQTVQQIAFLLGENASDSEQMLRTIIESFESGGD